VSRDAGDVSEPEDKPEPASPAGWSRVERRQSARRRRQLEIELDDAEAWLIRSGELIEAARVSGRPEALVELAELQAEYAAARDQLDALWAEWELLA
jgi:hypothetical protein